MNRVGFHVYYEKLPPEMHLKNLRTIKKQPLALLMLAGVAQNMVSTN